MAYFTRRFIEWQQVGTIWKVIIYGAGGYIAIPNYGLFREETIPFEMQVKHQAITAFPWVTYILSSILFAFFIKVH